MTIADYIQQKEQAFLALDADTLENTLHNLLQDHARYMDEQCLNLYAGTNIMNPRAAQLLSSSVGSRPSLGYPSDKYEMGMHYAEQLEIMAAALIKKLFKCQYAEIRVGSGSLANLYAFMATTQPGDHIMAFSDAAAGHVTHHTAGAAGLYGLHIHDVPFDGGRMTINLDELARQAEQIKPKLIIVGGSMCLFPYPLAAVRAIADSIGAYVMFDAAHMSGLIAGGTFQQPLAEGAHLLTMSTYKSFGGPPSGLVLTNDAELAARLDKIAYPGLTANFDLSKTAAMIITVLDWLEYGADYAQMCITTAQHLAAALDQRGVPVYGVEGRGFTESHHIAIQAAQFGGGTTASRLLEKANILAGGIGLPVPPVEGDFNAMRLGTQETTRLGMRPDDMPQVAEFIARVLIKGEAPEQVQQGVIEYRKDFQTLHFIRK